MKSSGCGKHQVSKDDITRGLRELGLRAGDLVVVHSSLSSFGYVVGGADAVIDSLLETVAEQGTLIMPSHTGCKKDGFESYDPETTPVRKSIGRIPDTFWRRPQVIRGTYPPRHPWAATGLMARRLITFSEDTPIEVGHYADILCAVAELDGYVLLLGCLNRNSTSIHSAQSAAFRAVEGIARPKREFLRSNPKRPEDFDQLDEPLRESGVMQMGRIAGAEIRLMRSRDLFAVVRRVYETRYRDRPVGPSTLNDVADPASRDAKLKAVVKELKALKGGAGRGDGTSV